jgi:hypothetical protein
MACAMTIPQARRRGSGYSSKITARQARMANPIAPNNQQTADNTTTQPENRGSNPTLVYYYRCFLASLPAGPWSSSMRPDVE